MALCRLAARAPLRHGRLVGQCLPARWRPAPWRCVRRGAVAARRAWPTRRAESRCCGPWSVRKSKLLCRSRRSEFVRGRGADTRDQVGRRPWRRGRGRADDAGTRHARGYRKPRLWRDRTRGQAHPNHPRRSGPHYLRRCGRRDSGGHPGSRRAGIEGVGPRRGRVARIPTHHRRSHRRNQRAVRGSADDTSQRIRAEHADPAPRDGRAAHRRRVAATFPTATGRLAVFVHGLFLTERSCGARRAPARICAATGSGCITSTGSPPSTCATTPGWTSLTTANAGRHAAPARGALAGLPIHQSCWWAADGGPWRARACCYGEQQQHRWTEAVRHVVCLGSPHLGTHLEKGVHIASWALARLLETRAVAGFLNARSAGIKDLRFGACIEDDWRDCDPDEFLQDRCQEVPFLPWPPLVATPAAPGGQPPHGDTSCAHTARAPATRDESHSRPEHGLTLTGLHHSTYSTTRRLYKICEWIRHHRSRPASHLESGLRQSS